MPHFSGTLHAALSHSLYAGTCLASNRGTSTMAGPQGKDRAIIFHGNGWGLTPVTQMVDTEYDRRAQAVKVLFTEAESDRANAQHNPKGGCFWLDYSLHFQRVNPILAYGHGSMHAACGETTGICQEWQQLSASCVVHLLFSVHVLKSLRSPHLLNIYTSSWMTFTFTLHPSPL